MHHVCPLGRCLCTPPVCEATLGQEEQSVVLADEGECVRRCGPLNISLAAEACRGKNHAAIKTVRIPQISDLRALIQDPNLNLKVSSSLVDPLRTGLAETLLIAMVSVMIVLTDTEYSIRLLHSIF